MSETMIAALISAAATLMVSIITLITNLLIERYKRKIEIQKNMYQSKQEHLNKTYQRLITIINYYPNLSPNDVLQYVEYPPAYFMESFDTVLTSLNYKIEDYEMQLDNSTLDNERKKDIKEQTSHIDYAKKKILEIRDKYNNAKSQYSSFCESDKMDFDLYAGQNVRNCLVEFEVVIHNVFISGNRAGNADDPSNNIIEVARRNLVNSIRHDIGIY